MVLILGTLLNRLFNTTFETMSGLSEGANLVLLKTIFEVYTGFGEAKRSPLRRKTHLMFVITDPRL